MADGIVAELYWCAVPEMRTGVALGVREMLRYLPGKLFVELIADAHEYDVVPFASLDEVVTNHQEHV